MSAPRCGGPPAWALTARASSASVSKSLTRDQPYHAHPTLAASMAHMISPKAGTCTAPHPLDTFPPGLTPGALATTPHSLHAALSLEPSLPLVFFLSSHSQCDHFPNSPPICVLSPSQPPLVPATVISFPGLLTPLHAPQIASLNTEVPPLSAMPVHGFSYPSQPWSTNIQWKSFPPGNHSMASLSCFC